MSLKMITESIENRLKRDNLKTSDKLLSERLDEVDLKDSTESDSNIKRFKEGKFTKEELKQLRKEVVLYSLYQSDYENSFGLPADFVEDFFDGYADFIAEVANDPQGEDSSNGYDNIDTLERWYNIVDYSVDEKLEESLGRYAQTDEQEEALKKVERICKGLGINLRFGTTIGKAPQTVILDKSYQDSAVYVNRDGKVTVFGEEVSPVSKKTLAAAFGLKESKNLKESYDSPNVEEISQILQRALDKLGNYRADLPVKLVSNTYFLNGASSFLGLSSRGYIDLDNPVDSEDDFEITGDFAEDFTEWYDRADYHEEVEEILEKYAREEDEEVPDIVQDIVGATEYSEEAKEDLKALSRISGVEI